MSQWSGIRIRACLPADACRACTIGENRLNAGFSDVVPEFLGSTNIMMCQFTVLLPTLCSISAESHRSSRPCRASSSLVCQAQLDD